MFGYCIRNSLERQNESSHFSWVLHVQNTRMIEAAAGGAPLDAMKSRTYRSCSSARIWPSQFVPAWVPRTVGGYRVPKHSGFWELVSESGLEDFPENSRTLQVWCLCSRHDGGLGGGGKVHNSKPVLKPEMKQSERFKVDKQLAGLLCSEPCCTSRGARLEPF